MATQSPAVKHHFWILFIAAPVFIIVARVIMQLMVGAEIGKIDTEFKSAKDGLSAQAKPKTELTILDQKVGLLDDNRKELWVRSYDKQKEDGVFNWPDSRTASFNALAKRDATDRKFKFGDTFPLEGRVTAPPVLKETFDKGYAKLGESIAPTRFATGNPVGTLRTVTDWGTNPAVEPAPFWLALEDYWVQRGLLEPIRQVNAAAALFAPVNPKDPDLKKTLRTRTWELELEVTTKGNKQVIQGQLRNLTPRLQPLGVSKAMKVNVWLRELTKEQAEEPLPADLPAPDVVFEIRGESVPGKGSITCTPQDVTTSRITRISRVSQVFDEATVPVRLVNTVDLGMLDHRNKAAELAMPKHIEADEAANPPDAAPPAGEGGPGAPGGPGSPGGPGPGGIGIGGGGGGGEGPGAPGGPGGYGSGAAQVGRKSGNIKAVLLNNKKRYVKRTDDVRRMPVALSVIIDNDYTNDLMVAYTNSPLHFQITQTQWARYKGVLPPVGGTSGGSNPPPGGPGIGEGTGTGDGPGGGVPGGGPPAPPGGGPGYPGPGGPGPGGIGGGIGGSGFLGGVMPSTSGMMPGEANANLCEFALFGIVSLYEKVPPEEPKPADGTPTAPMDPKPDPMKPADPMDPKVDPMKPADPVKPADPMGKPDGEKKEPMPPAPPKPDDGKKDPPMPANK